MASTGAAGRLTSLSRHVREFRLHLCQKSPSSSGARNFVEQHYVEIKKLNPSLPILVRECSGIQPTLTARYGKGLERSVSLSDQSAENILQSIEQLSSPQ